MKTFTVFCKGVPYEVKVDDEDFASISAYRWHIRHSASGRAYVCRSASRKGIAKVKQIYLHRQILGDIPRGMLVDHANMDSMDNRRANLRIATASQNQGNRVVQKRSASQLKGVFYSKRDKKWCARMRNKYLGLFETPQDAAKAYDVAAKNFYGEFARLNEVQS